MASDAATSDRKGQCLCGKVRFTVRGAKHEMSVCHCGQCRRWASGPFFSVHCAELEYEGDARPIMFQSSKWAERGACGTCGASLIWRLTAAGPHKGVTTVSLGALEDQTGFEITREWFIDNKPAAYTLAGERACVTEAEAMAMLSGD